MVLCTQKKLQCRKKRGAHFIAKEIRKFCFKFDKWLDCKATIFHYTSYWFPSRCFHGSKAWTITSDIAYVQKKIAFLSFALCALVYHQKNKRLETQILQMEVVSPVIKKHASEGDQQETRSHRCLR